MLMKLRRILGIETSCDETACALIEGKEKTIKILSNIVSSQIDLHASYGGVVPEIAARAHLENILPVLKLSLNKAKIGWKDIDAIAVTIGPGLLVSLLTGIETAKTLAYIFHKPIIPINHIEGHIYANFVATNHQSLITNCSFPLLCLVVSGGHTSLILMKNHGRYEILGETLDDAAGEAFDKVGNLLGLPYPGGPFLAKIAQKGDPQAFHLPRAWLGNSLDFSFSGLKTAVLYKIKQLKIGNSKLEIGAISDLAASCQQAIIDVLTEKTLEAARRYKTEAICLTGGVAANLELRKQLRKKCQKTKKALFVPPPNLCTDNAAMIACAGYYHFLKKDFSPWQKIKADLNPRL